MAEAPHGTLPNAVASPRTHGRTDRQSVVTSFRTEQVAYCERKASMRELSIPCLDAQPHTSMKEKMKQESAMSSSYTVKSGNAPKMTAATFFSKIKVIPVSHVSRLSVASRVSTLEKRASSHINQQKDKRGSLMERARSIRLLEQKVTFVTRRRVFFQRLRQFALYLFVLSLILGVLLYIILSSSDSTTIACCAGQVTTIVQGPRATAMALDSNGTLYIVDAFATKISTLVNGSLNDFAGTTTYADVDGALSDARFLFPTGIAIDASTGIIYVATRDSQTIRVIQNGYVSTMDYMLSAPSPQTSLPVYVYDDEIDYYAPLSLAVDGHSNLYVGSGAAVERIASDGSSVVLAGNSWRGYADGSSDSARFHYVRSLAVDAAGQFVYVADMYNKAIRRIDVANSVVTTMTLNGFQVTSTTRRPDCFQFIRPMGIALGLNDTQLYVADSWNNSIVVFDVNGALLDSFGTTNFGNQDDFMASAERKKAQDATFGNPWALAVDANGIIYVGDTGNRVIRRIAP
ncbi:Aste57867_13781 [Aphanomyces stellatus]|uniref:Aste57867_13781 protein n=1 Tax=Aphanomyces stellatus TaxID=120398 RepID=A0A485L0Q0_9STRA|nr:hypothetical protein As57867_013731 [Aphanomyces stellatus]VFT90614.1 Aste57867_13781 [Aphanomyces stellatus]